MMLTYVVSNTYKHQLLYKMKHMPFNRGIMPVREDPWRIFPWNKVPRNDSRKKTYRRILQRSFRRKTKQLIQMGEYDNLPLRPLRYAWFVD